MTRLRSNGIEITCVGIDHDNEANGEAGASSGGPPAIHETIPEKEGSFMTRAKLASARTGAGSCSRID